MNKAEPFLILIFIAAATFAADAAKTVKIQDINTRTTTFLNKSVTVHGEIERMLNSNTFILDGNGAMNDEILVVRVPTSSAQSNSMAASMRANEIELIEKDNKIQLTGVVKRLSIGDLRREYGLEFDPKDVAEFDGTFPVVITTAHDIKVIKRD